MNCDRLPRERQREREQSPVPDRSPRKQSATFHHGILMPAGARNNVRPDGPPVALESGPGGRAPSQLETHAGLPQGAASRRQTRSKRSIAVRVASSRTLVRCCSAWRNSCAMRWPRRRSMKASIASSAIPANSMVPPSTPPQLLTKSAGPAGRAPAGALRPRPYTGSLRPERLAAPARVVRCHGAGCDGARREKADRKAIRASAAARHVRRRGTFGRTLFRWPHLPRAGAARAVRRDCTKPRSMWTRRRRSRPFPPTCGPVRCPPSQNLHDRAGAAPFDATVCSRCARCYQHTARCVGARAAAAQFAPSDRYVSGVQHVTNLRGVSAHIRHRDINTRFQERRDGRSISAQPTPAFFPTGRRDRS